MKKKMAKAISILLVSLMLVAMFPAAFAAEPAEVTVSVKDTVFTGSAWTGYEDSIVIDASTTVTRKNWVTVKNSAGSSVGGYRIPSASKAESKNVFSVNVKAEASAYEVYVTPVKSGRGCSYTVTVDGISAGRIDTRDTNLGNADYVVADTVQLSTVSVTPDENGWVNITFENVSARSELADGYNDTIGFTEITLVPTEIVTYTGISENISGKDLYVGKTADFEIAATMSDESTFKFDGADTETNNITAAVTAGDSVSLSDVAIGSDGKLHGKIKGLAATESTITVTVKIGEMTDTLEINVTPKVYDGGDITVSMLASNITTTNINFGGNGSVSDGYTITWNDECAVLVPEETNIGYLKQVYGLVDGKKPIFAIASGRYYDAQFTFKTKIPFDGAYTISLTPILSQLGGIYGVWVNDKYAGSVNSWNGIAGTSGWNSTTTAGDEVSLNTLNLKADADGYVKIKLKNLSDVLDTTIADSYKDAYNTPVAFQEITLTPTADLAVSSLSENISTTEIYNGETYDFYIKAVMNDGLIHKFDTSDTSDKITATVSSGSAVSLYSMEMREDGLYGKLAGVGDDEKATITVKTTINGVTDTKTIDVISFATEVKTPETVAVSMARGGELTTTVDSADRYVFASTDKITWGEGDKIRLDYDKTVITNFRESSRSGGIWYPAVNSSDETAGFTVKVRASEGTYKVDATRAYSSSGCVYEIFVDGKSVGTIDGSGKLKDTDGGTDVTIGEKVSLDTVSVTPDENGWVEITVKYVEDGEATAVSGTTRYLLFKDITLTPTQKVYVTADTPSGALNSLITCEGYEVGTIANVAFKSSLVLNANDTETNKFLYWINNSTKQVISEEATLTLPVTSNATISAVYSESGNARYDYFTSTGQRIASYFGSAPATAPEIPSAIGYVSAGEWTEDNSYETDDYVAYAPDYTNATPLTFETEIDGEERTVTYDDEITVTAEEANFSYWAKGGKAVSFMSSYTFFAWGDEIVEKICGVSVPAKERKPQVVLFNRGNDYMLELVACEDVEVIEKGILFAENGTPTIGSAITKAKSNSDSLQFTASSEYSVARAYLVYRDDDGVKVVYSK